MSIPTNKESCLKTLGVANTRKVALVYHLTIKDTKGYNNWLSEPCNNCNGKRLFRVQADPVPREGMFIDEIVIDEFQSLQSASDNLTNLENTFKQVCSDYTILAIVPEPRLTFHIVKGISWLVRLFKGVADKGILTANWKAENVAVWPDANQMEVSRSQDLNEPLFVYNLNKYKTVANYKNYTQKAKKISGKEAYDRYAKIAGFELLRRGAYPVYGGKPLCLFSSQHDCMLADHWDHFIFVRYPQRRNLLAMIESNEFHKGEIHREAGLERVAIFMTKKPIT